jgi:hypothetical protein
LAYTVLDGNGGVATATLSISVFQVGEKSEESPSREREKVRTPVIEVLTQRDIPSGTVPSSSGQLSWAPQWTAVGASEWLPFQIGTPYVSIAVRESQTEQSLSMMLIDVRLIEAPLLGEALHAVTDGMRFQDGSWVFPIEHLATENYVQRAVRHQPLTEDHGLYVQHAVRASQLEAAVRMRAADVWFLLATDINDTFNPFALNSTNPMQRGDLSVLQGSVL